MALATSGDRGIFTLGAARSAAGARMRALAEAEERTAGFFQGDEPRVRASFRDLGNAAVHPNRCLLYSAKQYRERSAPRAFDPDSRIEWSPLWSVTHAEWRYLPTALLYYDYPRRPFGRADSNGAGAHRSRPRAALRGVLELVERDSVALWWYNRTPRPGVPLRRFRDPWLHRLLDWYDGIGRDCWALDLTSDLGIPVVAALSRRREPPESIVMGFGADPDRHRAAERAMLEMTQLLAVSRDAARGRVRLPPAARRWLASATTAGEPHLLPGAGRVRRAEARARRTTFERLAARLSRMGLEVLVSDQTRPGSRFRVVRVMVPGLRSWWPRFAPGRLYRAPVTAGWITRPRRESELNPEPFFL